MTETLILIVPVILGATGVWLYNRLVTDRNLVEAGWADIDVQLKRRHDLIPRLVSCVKAYADFERATLEAVAELRQQSEEARDLMSKASIEDAIESGLHKVIVTVEDYPELKADNNFRELQAELIETENRIQYARRFYNGAVRNLNTRIESFPTLLIADPLGFKEAQFFAVHADAERQAPTVELR